MGRPTPHPPPPIEDIWTGDSSVRLGKLLSRSLTSTRYRAQCEGSFGVSREVAVEVFDVLASDDQEVVLTALAEAARRSACVRHPNVVRIESFGVTDQTQPYVVTELLEGKTLADFIELATARGGRIQPDLALFIGCEVADALGGAHEAQTADGNALKLVHGALSPCDVHLSWQGEVKVSDFGFAAAKHVSSAVHCVRSLSRRMWSIAPEVARGREADARSDVFALGILLHEMLVGPRFPSYAPDAKLLQWMREGHVHRSIFEPLLPAPLQTILDKALAPEPSRRYPDAATMGQELRKVALGLGVGDGRAFLRSALTTLFKQNLLVSTLSADEMGDPTLRKGGKSDRFARLRAVPQEEADDLVDVVDVVEDEGA